MDKLISIYRLVDGVETTVCTISKENASLSQSIMDKDKVTISVVTEDPLYLAEGDYILLDGVKYRINRDPEDKQSSDKEHSYDISFEAPIYTLIDKIYCNKITGSTTVTLTGKLRDFLELLIWNINYDTTSNPLGVDTGWEIGLCPDTDYMNLTLETTKCRDALDSFASKFELEYYVTNKTINFVSHIENETGLVFTQGEGKGLYEVERKNVDDGDLVTRVYVKGGTENITPGEGDSDGRLMLPEGYIENLSESQRGVEAVVVFDSIHPTFQGSVGNVSGDNSREFLCQEIDFNIADVAVGDEARVNFLTGDLMGKSFEFKWDNSLKKITLIYQEDDLAAIDPNTGSRPNIPSSSKYLRGGELFNFTGLKLSGTYKTNAITKLREKGTDWLAYYCRKRVKFELNVDYRYLRKNNTELHCGDLITINVPLHNISKLIRVTAIERNLYTGKLTCTVSNYLDEKWKDKIEDQIAEIKTSTATINGGYGGATVTILENNDEREPSDSNVFSALRSLKEIVERALSRKNDDSAAGLITFIKGLVSEKIITAKEGVLFGNFLTGETGAKLDANGNAEVRNIIARIKAKVVDLEVTNTAKAKDVEVSNKVTTLDAVIQALAKAHDLTVENTADIMHGIIREYLTSDSFVSGFLGSGFKIWKDENGLWHGELDELTVRNTFLVFELVVQKIVHQGGMIIRSAAGGKLKKVTDGGTYWKCEYDSTDDFVAGDQVLCQTFTGTSMKRYWRLVTSAGAGYFNLSKSDCETGSANPELGDEVAVLGNRTVIARQKAQIDCAVGDDAPYRDDYSGINSYSLVGKLINRVGNLSGITDPDFGALSGSGLYGINVYLKGIFRLLSGKTVETAISDAQAESNAYTDGKITTVETNFEIREGQISSKVTEATSAATNAGNSAILAQGYANTAGSKASDAAGSATIAGQKAADAAGSASDASNVLSAVIQKETSINQTADAIELKAVRAESAAGRAENAESSINLKADGIVLQASNQAAQTAVNGVQVGGRNLLIGSSNGNGWGYETRNGTEFSINRASTGETGYIYSGYFQLQGNQVYTLSFESKEDAKITSRDLFILSNAYQSNNAILTWGFAKGVDWHKVIITFTTGSQFNGVSDVRLRIDHNGSSDGSSATIFVRNIKLEIGNKATDWTPAPEDVAQDASDKASAAESNAKTYTQQNYASISLLNNAISLLATKETVNSINGRLQSAEAKITPDQINLTVKSQTQTIAQQAVDGVQVGGRNYYSNYSTTLTPILGSPYFEKNNINTPNGIYMVGDSSGSSAIRLFNVITNNGYWTISFDIKGSQSAIVGFNLEINDVYISKVLTTEYNNWVHKSYTLNVTNYSHDVYNFVDFQYISFAYIFLKNIKIEYGNKPTDWTPAPEDVDNSIALRPTTDEIKSSFTMDSSGISMIGKKISFTGLMTFSSLATDAQNKITTAQSTADAANSTAGSALSSANAANTDLSTLKGNLGSLAYLNTVSLAKLDTTIVEGGYIKTSLIDAASVVTGQLIANLINATDITTGRLTVTDGSMLGGLTVSGNSLTNAGFNNDATIILRNDYYGIFSAIGTNTLPTSSGLRAVARFENNNTKGGIWGSSNYAMIVGATGANNNIAVSISGGYISRMARKVQIVTNLSTTIDIEAGLVIVITNLSGDVNLYLPTTYTHDDGHTIKIKNARTSGAVRITAGYGYQTDGTYSHNAIMYDSGSVGWDNALALSANGDATEIIYCRDITSNGYRGIWMQFKNPRDW